MLKLKWTATYLCLAGIALTSYNIYPANIFLSGLGSAMWACAGWKQQDTPLMVVEAVAVLFYLSGIITWLVMLRI
jgi:hypothetical protein